jgi:hypothetical protein
MQIQVTRMTEQTLSSGRYVYVEMTAGKHTATISVEPKGALRVIVQNASHRAWRGMGKYFGRIDQALASYKTEAVKAMITHAVELARVSETNNTGVTH